MLGLSHGRRHACSQHIAIDTRGCREIGDGNRNMIETVEHGVPVSEAR
jgi:hypothetical protein